jgi:hypothetical protein
MRLTKELAQRATAELLHIIERRPNISTSDLSGTPWFHGERILRNRQIIRLLKASGKAKARLFGFGNHTYYAWRLDDRGQARV